MNSFDYEKKMEFERLAKKAVNENNDKLAFNHTCQAAMYTVRLAKSCDEDIARRYLAEGWGLLKVAKQLMEKIQSNGGEAGIDYDGGYYLSSAFFLNNLSGVSGPDVMGGGIPGAMNGGRNPGSRWP